MPAKELGLHFQSLSESKSLLQCLIACSTSCTLPPTHPISLVVPFAVQTCTLIMQTTHFTKQPSLSKNCFLIRTFVTFRMEDKSYIKNGSLFFRRKKNGRNRTHQAVGNFNQSMLSTVSLVKKKQGDPNIAFPLPSPPLHLSNNRLFPDK